MSTQPPVPIPESKEVWKRGLIMLLLAIAFGLAQMVLNAIAFVQFFWLLFTRQPNTYLTRFGSSLALWLGDVARFQTCAADDKPFPWRDWP